MPIMGVYLLFSIKNIYLSKSKYLALFLVFCLAIQFIPAFEQIANASTLYDIKATIVSNNTIYIEWQDGYSDERSYRVERKTDSGQYVQIAYLTANSTLYYDTWVTAGHTYTYRIRVENASYILNTHTEEVSLTTADIEKPNSLSVKTQGPGQIDLKWTYDNQKAYNTIIERRSENETSWYIIAQVTSGQTTYSDTSVQSGVKYFYKVRAYTMSNIRSSAYPDEYTGTGAYTLLNNPTDLFGFAITQYQIQLKWQDNSSETAFIIERRSPSEGVFKEIAIVPQNTISYIDTVPDKDIVYAYRIKAATGTSVSEYSEIISVTSTYLRAPSYLQVLCLQDDDGLYNKLTWSDFSEDETAFEVWRRSSSKSTWEKISEPGRNATICYDRSIVEGETYSYKLRAKIYNNNVYSDYSNEAIIWTSKISAPQDLRYSIIDSNKVQLSWRGTSSIDTNYKVEKKLGESGYWYEIANLDAASMTYTDVGVASTKDLIYYRIKIQNTNNTANYSNEVAVSLQPPTPATNVKANPISFNQVRITWTDNALDENEYIIEAMQFYNFREVGRVSANNTSFVHKGLSPNATVTYRIIAVNGVNKSEYSKTVVATTPPRVLYSDVYDNKSYSTAVATLASMGVFSATPGKTLKPDETITRAEFCSLLIRSLELEKSAAGKFTDVSPTNNYYSELMTAARLGIMIPDSSNKLYPNNKITREQALIMLTRAMHLKNSPLPEQNSNILRQYFDYNNVSNYAVPSVSAVCGAKLYEGETSNGRKYLYMKNQLSRAQAAQLLYNAMQYQMGGN